MDEPSPHSGKPTVIRYRFTLASGVEERFELELDPDTLEYRAEVPATPPPWTRLAFEQCSNCPLSSAEHAHCPVALNLVGLVRSFDGVVSHDPVELAVQTEERLVSLPTTAQEGVSSLVGLIMATSACPHTSFFRPMARFHLPLASDLETIYRSTSMYLLGQYFRSLSGQPVDARLDGLKDVYETLRVVNRALAARLRAASESDSTVNAVVMLDVYAILVHDAIEDSLEELRPLFDVHVARGAD